MYSDLDFVLLAEEGYPEADYFTRREADDTIARARKYADTARQMYSIHKDVLITRRIKQSDIALRSLVTQSHLPQFSNMPWREIVPVGLSARENLQQRLLYSLSLAAEKNEDKVETDNLTNFRMTVQTPTWWNGAAITCTLTDVSLNEHTDVMTIATKASGFRAYCTRSPESWSFAVVSRVGHLRAHTVRRQANALESWSKGQDAKKVMNALYVAAHYESTFPDLFSTLFDVFGVPRGLRHRLTELARSNQLLPTSITLAPLTKYTNWMNIADITSFCGVESNALLYPRLIRLRAAPEAYFYWSCFYAYTRKVIKIEWTIPSLYHYHGITQFHLRDLSSNDHVVLLRLKRMPERLRSNGPLNPTRLDEHAQQNWMLSTTPEAAQFQM